MNEPTIMPTKPGAISAEDKATLREIGVVVIECEDPASLRLIRPDSMVSGNGMLYAALKGVMNKDAPRSTFTEEIFKQVCEAWGKENRNG